MGQLNVCLLGSVAPKVNVHAAVHLLPMLVSACSPGVVPLPTPIILFLVAGHLKVKQTCFAANNLLFNPVLTNFTNLKFDIRFQLLFQPFGVVQQ